MVICAVDNIPDEIAPPTREAIETQRQRQMEALTELRRALAATTPEPEER